MGCRVIRNESRCNDEESEKYRVVEKVIFLSSCRVHQGNIFATLLLFIHFFFFFCLATRLLFFVKRPNYFVSGQFADLFKKNFSFSLQFNSPDASVPRQTQILTPLPPSLGSKRSGGQTTGSRRGGGVNEGGGGGEEKEKEEEEEGVTEFKLVFFWDKEGGIFSQSLKNRPNWAPPPHFEANRLFPILHTYSVLPSRTWQC